MRKSIINTVENVNDQVRKENQNNIETDPYLRLHHDFLSEQTKYLLS
jgi:hypothetical protein